MQELAELDKKEMENEYQMFADQYSELKTQINNDSIIEQLTQEQLKTELAQASFEAGFRLAMGLLRELEDKRIRLQLEEEG